MKAAVYYQTGGPEVFRYEEVADPVCAPDGVRIDVKVVSIEGGDTLHRSGGELAARPLRGLASCPEGTPASRLGEVDGD